MKQEVIQEKQKMKLHNNKTKGNVIEREKEP